VKPTATAWLLLLASPMAFGAFNSLGPRPVEREWREEVRLRTGETVMVDRSVGSGSPTLSFKWKGRTIKSGDDLPGLPHVIDIYDGVPVLVVPINGSEQCIKYGYPEDSLVAWRYEGGKWVRMAAAPENVLVNLRKDWPERDDDNEVVTIAWKQKNQGRNAGGPYGLPLAAYTAKFSEGCARLPDAPARKAQTAVLARPVVRAEDAAAVVLAERVSFATAPEEVSGRDAMVNMGEWIDNVPVWRTRRCANLFAGFRVVNRQYPGNQHPATEVSLLLHAKVADPRIVVQGKPDYVFCDDRTIVVLRRGVAERMLVTRFDPKGTLIDAYRVQLPGLAELSAGAKEPPKIWNVSVEGAQLTLTMADYAYKNWETDGGTLRRKAVYEARLPDR
jgi:hypothetical protein